MFNYKKLLALKVDDNANLEVQNMISSLVVLGKVAVLCGVGFGVATGFEWFSDLEVKPKNKIIKIGESRKENVNDTQIDNLSKRIKQQD